MNKQTERMNRTEILNARFILQHRSDDHLIARNAVEPDHRRGHVADAFLAFRTQEEAEAYRRAMRADQFEVVELPPDVWPDACRSFLQEGLTYISLLRTGIATRTLTAGTDGDLKDGEESGKQPAESEVP